VEGAAVADGSDGSGSGDLTAAAYGGSLDGAMGVPVDTASTDAGAQDAPVQDAPVAMDVPQQTEVELVGVQQLDPNHTLG